MSTRFSSIEKAVAAIAAGRIIIVVDAEDRENEGDFVCAAEKATPEIVNFMISHGRGQVCMPLLPEVCDRLKLGPMVENNTAPLGTAFTVPVDHRTTKTGITAQERAATIRALVDPRSQPSDFVRPATCSHSWPKKGACCAAPATPRPPSTWPAWPVFRRPACCAKSSTTMAIGPTAKRCLPWLGSITWKSSRSRS